MQILELMFDLTSRVIGKTFFLARSLLPSCVTVIQIESEMTRRRLDYSMSGFVYASGAVTMPDDHVTRCLCTYASHPTKFSR